MKTVVLKINGLTEEQLQEALTDFLNEIPYEYPSFLGAGVSIMREGSEGEKTILEIAKL